MSLEEVEAFLATQLVDEMRHAVFFDRFAGEVMTMSADDLRGLFLLAITLVFGSGAGVDPRLEVEDH